MSTRGVNAVTINYGSTPSLGSSVPGITNFSQTDATNTHAGEVFSSFTPFTARDIDSNYGDTNNFHGLSEGQFDGNLVPEPASFILGGLGLLALPRRRR